MHYRARDWIVALLCGAGAMVLVVALAILPQTRADQQNQDRAAAQLASCVQYNHQRVDAIESDVEVVQAIFTFLLPFARVQPPPGRLDRLYRVVRAASAKGHPARDCTPAGIAAYLKAHP